MEPDGRKDKLRKGEVLAGFIVIVLIFVITVVNLLLPDKEFSEK